MARARAFALLVAACLIGACTTVPPAAPRPIGVGQQDEPFIVEGRLSARHGAEAIAANFRWTHVSGVDTITLGTPLGQTVAKLSGSGGGTRIERSDGSFAEAADWESLTERALGVPLPVAGLTYWIRGYPRPAFEYSIESDAAGRPLVLRQDGWEIIYGYAEDASPLPARLRMNWPDVDLRIAIDGWH